jgi:pectin methylesterase-like acyl-CoA thioesterase
VAASGTGDYYSIQRAIDVASEEGATISIAPGTYRERLKITKPNIRLRSPYPEAKRTVIVFDASAGTAGGTLKSATVEVRAPGFSSENLTFANDFNATHPQLPQGSQALALLLAGDKAVLRNVRLLGNQDTLYTSAGRQFFTGCYIEGNVDFIFGDGKTLFENCEIHSTSQSIGYLTAQGRNAPDQDGAFVFDHCRLTAEPGVSNVYLGRPWRPYARVIFLNTLMGDHILPAGWREWHPGETHSIETAYYAEYNSTGPGANPKDRDPHTKQLTGEEAKKYDIGQFFGGWEPR